MITKKVLQDTIDDAIAELLGSLVKVVATKDDLKELAGKDDLKRVENRLGNVENRLGKVEVELKDVNRNINDLKADTPTPQEFAMHEKRLSKLEQAVFPA